MLCIMVSIKRENGNIGLRMLKLDITPLDSTGDIARNEIRERNLETVTPFDRTIKFISKALPYQRIPVNFI